MTPTQEQIEALRFWSESALTRKLYRGDTPLSETLADVVETLSQARAAPAPGWREGYAATLKADLAEMTRRRDNWRKKAEGYDAVRLALREKVGSPWPPHMSRLLWAGIAADEKKRADAAEAEVARLRKIIFGEGVNLWDRAELSEHDENGNPTILLWHPYGVPALVLKVKAHAPGMDAGHIAFAMADLLDVFMARERAREAAQEGKP